MNERIEPVAVHLIPSHRVELHLMGEHVAVCWTVKEMRVTNRQAERLPGGGTQVVETTRTNYWRKEDRPYIRFVVIEDDVDGPYIREESPVEGGISVAHAHVIVAELQRAIAYIQQLEREAAS